MGMEQNNPQYENENSSSQSYPQMMGGMSQYIPQNNANMITMTDPEEVVRRLEATYRGQVLDENGQYNGRYTQIMNEEGVSKIIGLIRSVVSRVTLMSFVDDHTYQQVMFEVGFALHKILMVNRVSFEINNNSDRELIKTSALTTCQFCILRALEGGERRFWKGTVQEFSYNVPNQENQSWVDKWMPKSWQQK